MTDLNLDGLLWRSDGQLAGSVALVDGSRDRLRWMLDAVAALGGELDLPTVVRRITEIALHIVDADFGALAVDGDERLSQFVAKAGNEGDLPASGHPAVGAGPLDSTGREGSPLLLSDLAEHPEFGGLPSGHPPMTSFLGVPIVIRGTVFGTLHLTNERPGQQFTETDQALVEVLASAAGVAIEDARVHAVAERRLAWLSASSEVTQALLGGRDLDEALRLVAHHVRVLSGADVGVVCRAADGGPVVSVADGKGARALVGQRLGADGALPAPFEGGPALVVELEADGAAYGVVAIANRRGGQTFDDEQEELARSFALQASVALKLAEHQREVARLSVFEDRDRIARDLHDLVIQQLFANGMRLASLSSSLTDPVQVERLEWVVDDLDATIRAIRSTIYALHTAELVPSFRPRDRLLQAAHAAVSVLRFVPSLQFEGPVDAVITSELADHLVAVLGESLTNVARHASARHVVVTVRAGEGRLTLSVRDDGVGLPAQPVRSSGLANLERRAVELGGCFERRRPAGGGLEVIWSVPLEQPKVLPTAACRAGAQPSWDPVEIAVLDRSGTIVSVNAAWADFARANGGDPERTGVGVSYLDVCAATSDALATEVSDVVRAAVAGALAAPVTLRVPCHSPQANRWFDLVVASLPDGAGGAVVTVSPAPRP